MSKYTNKLINAFDSIKDSNRWVFTSKSTLTPKELSKSRITKMNNSIFRLNNENRYVVKIFVFTESDVNNNHNMMVRYITTGFMNEIRVASMDGIEEVGTRLQAWFNDGNIIAHIMDNATMGKPSVNAIDLKDYDKRYVSSRVKSMILNALLRFYIITQGFHGDLHGSNIMLIVSKALPTKVVDVRLIDYETHVPFSKKIASNATIEYALKRIEETWAQMNGKEKRLQEGSHRIRRRNVQNNRQVAINTNLLKTHNISYVYSTR